MGLRNNMDKEVIAFDSKRFIRGKFQALIGVSVSVKEKDLSNFCAVYDTFMKKLFEKHNIPRRRLIYKSFDLKRIFFPLGVDPIEEFVKETKENIGFLDLYYSYFKNKTLAHTEKENHDQVTDFVNIYYEEPEGSEQVSAIKFLNIIEPAYPAICAWGYMSRNPSCVNNIFIMDHFSARPSKLWDQLKDIKSMQVVYDGGKCNYLISTADLYLACIEERIKKENLALNRSIHKILHPDFGGKFETTFLGTKYLYNISPAKKSEINLQSKLQHPIFYVFTEGNDYFSKLFTINRLSESAFLETTPFLEGVFNLAAKQNGSVKFYDPARDNQYILPQDKFYYYGQNGLNKIQELKKVGFTNETYSAENISKL